MRLEFTDLRDYDRNRFREWSVGNGLGGYAGGNILGGNNRTHQGYLIASMHPPVERYLILSKTKEKVKRGQNAEETDFECARHRTSEGAIYESNGNQFLDRFVYDGCANFFYQGFRERFQKTVVLDYGSNRCGISYEIENLDDAAMDFVITPLFNFKEHSASQTVEGLQNAFGEVERFEKGVRLHLSNRKECITMVISDGSVMRRDEQFDIDTMLQTEIDNETEGVDCHFQPVDVVVHLEGHEKKQIDLLCGFEVELKAQMQIKDLAEPLAENTAAVSDKVRRMIEGRWLRNQKLEEAAQVQHQDAAAEEFYNELVCAADALIVKRASTGYRTILAGLPWFTDWGRDTMIAFTGLTLCTNRFEDAKEILLTFAKYVHHGMVPNMFPDDGQDPLYNTADASLWYFYAVHKYLEYDNSKEAEEFIRACIYPALKKIVEGYQKGTDFAIGMDEDGLIHAGSGLDQVTWMDVRVGDWVPTPRHGKPVEINALWYNALKVMENLELRWDNRLEAKAYDVLAEKVRKSFQKKFWYEEGGYLYDVIGYDVAVNKEVPDETLRPNQIYAVSLPYSILNQEQEKKIVDVVKEKLYVGVGLRSLSPEHQDYHPIYLGALAKRDAAYHQGTAWGFLLGGFISAYVKVYGGSSKEATKQAKKQARLMLEPVMEHMRENGIGTISEIFDGDAPHYGRGCYSQAWSVGEVLRCYREDIL